MRLLMGLAAGCGADVTLRGDESLSKRPMERVAQPLRRLGAKIETCEGHAPVCVTASRLIGCEVDTKVASAQVKSALLLAALFAEGETAVPRTAALARSHRTHACGHGRGHPQGRWGDLCQA